MEIVLMVLMLKNLLKITNQYSKKQKNKRKVNYLCLTQSLMKLKVKVNRKKFSRGKAEGDLQQKNQNPNSE